MGRTGKTILMLAAPLIATLCPGALAGQVFVSSESPHFLFNYVRGGAADRDIPLIVANRERAYGAISAFLGAEDVGRIQVTLYPDRESALSGPGAGSTSGDSISAVYSDLQPLL